METVVPEPNKQYTCHSCNHTNTMELRDDIERCANCGKPVWELWSVKHRNKMEKEKAEEQRLHKKHTKRVTKKEAESTGELFP